MSESKLSRAVTYAHDALQRRRAEGKIKAFVSLEGHLTLLADKIERWFSEGRNEGEVVGLAVDALLALSMVMPPEVDVDRLVESLREENHT